MSKNTFRGLTRSIAQQLLMVLLLFAAIPLQMLSAGDVRTYQGVTLKKPTFKNNAYQVGSREELLWWAVNDQDENLCLTADINLQGGKQLLSTDGQALKLLPYQVVVWPFVYYNSACPTIDGNNHTISGLYQENGYGVEGKLGSYEAYDWVGFVSYSKPTITIKNLNIADSYFRGKVAGGFMGQKSKHATSTSTAYLTNCTFSGLVIGDQYAGGFVGHYRTDGQDAEIYRCINYGTVQAGSYYDSDIYAAAGGIVGYLDVTHAAFAKANTNFNRCVNYGNICNVTPGANVGGIVGRVWDNNNGVREWRFCFNFGEVTKLDHDKNKLAGSGLIGNYIHTNDKSEPKILGCGNARKSDTGAVLDSLTWNAKSKAPVMSGLKVIKSEKLFSSIEKDESWATWWSNNMKNIGMSSLTLVAALGITAISVIFAVFGAPIMAVYGGILAAAMYAETGYLMSDAFNSGDIGAIYDSLRSNNDASKTMSDATLMYGQNDVRTAYFAYDCNLMMQSDSVGGEKNDDKSILFVQHVNVNDTTQNDSLPSIIAANASQPDNILYYGYKGCNRMPRISNERDLLSAPLPHTYAADGSCTVCGMKLEPLDVVTKQVDGKVVVDYYTIRSASQLRYLASVFNGEDVEGSAAAYEAYAGATFKLLNDITLEDYVMWSPIGSYNSYGTGKTSDKWHPFRGFFDGQGHTIRGLRTDEHVNYAGLFGDVYKGSGISNVKLSDCSFSGNIAGSIAGRLDTKGNMYYGSNENIVVNNSGADSSVVVTAVSANENSYGGGLFGEVNPYVDNALRIVVTNCYSNVLLQQRNQGYKANAQKILGAFAGSYNPDQYIKKYGINDKPTFKYCYFGGTSSTVADLNYVGTVKGSLNENRFVDCYMVGDQAEAFDRDNSSSRRVVRSYISGGRLAYDLMVKSLTDGKFLWGQKGSYPVIVDDTSVPSLCKINMIAVSAIDPNYSTFGKEYNIGDTIINKRDPKLSGSINYGDLLKWNFKVRGWANDNNTDKPTETSQSIDFLYDKPWYRYEMVLGVFNKSSFNEIRNESLVKLIGWIFGIGKAKIATDLNLTGDNEYTLKYLPYEIDGNYHSIRIAKPLMESNPSNSVVDSVVLVRDLCVIGDTVSKGILLKDQYNKKRIKSVYRNLITVPINLDKTFISYLDESEKDYLSSITLENVVNKKADSTAMSISNGKGDAFTETTFSDAKKNNTYESILGYMLKHNMLDTFGLRLDGKDEKVAGKFGFAADANKRIYRVKLYNQATGAESGEVLMNYDGKCTFKVDGDKLGAMSEGIPAGYFAVLPMTKVELSDKFIRLAANIITKDGYANIIRLNDNETAGFAYPSCFPDDDDDTSLFTITASRAEYVRNIRRDGLHESVYLPYVFTSIEFDEDELHDDDEMDLAFMDASDGDGLSADGIKFELTSLSSYYAKQREKETDPSADEKDKYFIVGVPYFINIDCAERTDETTEVTFVGYNVGFLRSAFVFDDVEPLYGTFNATTAGNVVKDKNVYLLGQYKDEATGKMVEKFAQVASNHPIKAFRSYLATNGAMQSIHLSIDDQDITDINNVVKGSVKADGKIYDILGRRINAANTKGVYIKNGKKVINLK